MSRSSIRIVALAMSAICGSTPAISLAQIVPTFERYNKKPPQTVENFTTNDPLDESFWPLLVNFGILGTTDQYQLDKEAEVRAGADVTFYFVRRFSSDACRLHLNYCDMLIRAKCVDARGRTTMRIPLSGLSVEQVPVTWRMSSVCKGTNLTANPKTVLDEHQ